MWGDDSWCLCCHIRGGVCYYLGPRNLLWSRYADDWLGRRCCSWLGVLKIFCSIVPRIFHQKGKTGGKVGAELAVRHHSPQLWQRQTIKKMQFNTNSLSDNTACALPHNYVSLAEPSVGLPHPCAHGKVPFSLTMMGPWALCPQCHPKRPSSCSAGRPPGSAGPRESPLGCWMIWGGQLQRTKGQCQHFALNLFLKAFCKYHCSIHVGSGADLLNLQAISRGTHSQVFMWNKNCRLSSLGTLNKRVLTLSPEKSSES